MANTLLELWSLQFPNGSPDANRDMTSAAGDTVRNPLSDTSKLDSQYTSNKMLPSGRNSMKALAILWNQLCLQSGVADNTLTHLTTDFGKIGIGTDSGGNAQDGDKAVAYEETVKKNVTVRRVETDAIVAVAAGTKTLATGHKVKVAEVKGQDAVMGAYTRGNYRLGSSNPAGAWGTFTGRPLTNGGEDIATISLQQYRDGMNG